VIAALAAICSPCSRTDIRVYPKERGPDFFCKAASTKSVDLSQTLTPVDATWIGPKKIVRLGGTRSNSPGIAQPSLVCDDMQVVFVGDKVGDG